MKNIITDILNFSHLNKVKGGYESVDLNKTINGVKNDLELIITQKNAVINAVTLPVIEAIPVQMNQLFYNLINNALKFSVPERAPVININMAKATPEDLTSLLPVNQNADYLKITVADNGIGFDQKYADQIFTMFQRLNDRQAYSGTGIGLALCKKIVENHHGAISAQSVAGAGATFIIILPTKQWV
jgi:light-regulated signal transduction histidine kinase (bacteriophytochrome)